MATYDANYESYFPTVPIFGSSVASTELRDNLNKIIEHHHGSSTPQYPAQIRSDIYMGSTGTIDFSSGYQTYMAFDDMVSMVLVNFGQGTTKTLAQIISTINSALGSTVAYDLDGYLFLKSVTDGSTGNLRLRKATTGDCYDLLFGFGDRDSTWQATPTAVVIKYGGNGYDGWIWDYDPDKGGTVDQSLRRRAERSGFLQGRGATYPISVNTSIQEGLDITLLAYSGSTPVEANLLFYPNLSSYSLANFVTYMNNRWNGPPYNGPGTIAYATSLDDGTSQFQFTTPYSNSWVRVNSCYSDDDYDEGPGGLRFYQNIAGDVFGWDTILNKYDRKSFWDAEFLRDDDVDWEEHFITFDTSPYPGIGQHKPHVIGSANLPGGSNNLTGDVRWEMSYGIPWMYSAPGRGAGWNRAIPGTRKSLTYDTDYESYDLRAATQHSMVRSMSGTNWVESTYMYQGAFEDLGNTIESVDQKDYRWWWHHTRTTPLSVDWHYSGLLNPVNSQPEHYLYRSDMIADDFNRADVQGTLGTNAWGTGKQWTNGYWYGNGWEIKSNKAYCNPGTSGGAGDYYFVNEFGLSDVYENLDMVAEISVTKYVGNYTPGDPDYAVGPWAGLVFNCPASHGSMYIVRLNCAGKLQIGRIESQNFQGPDAEKYINKCLSTDSIVLRVRKRGNTVSVYVGGSLDRTRWEQDETADLTYNVTEGYTGIQGGIYAYPAFQDGVGVYFDHWMFFPCDVHTVTDLVNDIDYIAGLPEVSGARLRDIICAADIGPDIAASVKGPINDCQPNAPLVIRGPIVETGVLPFYITKNTEQRSIIFKADSLWEGGSGGGGGHGWVPPGSGGGSVPPWNPPPAGPSCGTSKKNCLCVDGETDPYGWLDPGYITLDYKFFMDLAVVDLTLDHTYIKNLDALPLWISDGGLDHYADLVQYGTDINTRRGQDINSVTQGTDDGWKLTDLVRDMLQASVSLYQGSDGSFPTWMTDHLAGFLDPGKPFVISGADTWVGPPRWIIEAIDKEVNLPTVGSGFDSNAIPPTGLMAVVWDETIPKSVYYDAGDDSWYPLNAYRGFKDITVTGTGTFSATGPEQEFIFTSGDGIYLSRNGNEMTITNIGGGSSGIVIEEAGVAVASGVTILDFLGGGAELTDQGGGEVSINLPWDLTSGVLNPRDALFDVAIGGNDDTSPFYMDVGGVGQGLYIDKGVFIGTNSPTGTAAPLQVQAATGFSGTAVFKAASDANMAISMFSNDGAKIWQFIIDNNDGHFYLKRATQNVFDCTHPGAGTPFEVTLGGGGSGANLTVNGSIDLGIAGATVDGVDLDDVFVKTSDTLDDITTGVTNVHFTSTDYYKLDGIEAGAEVNNMADGHVFILTAGTENADALHSHTFAGDKLDIWRNGTLYQAAIDALDLSGEFTLSYDAGNNKVRADINYATNSGLRYVGGEGMSITWGNSQYNANYGNHNHQGGAGQGNLIDYELGLTNQPTTMEPDPHTLDGAKHTGNLSASKVLVTTSFADSSQYTLGKTSPSAVRLNIGHNGSMALCTEFYIANHNHSGAGSGGTITWASISDPPATYDPTAHASDHLDGQSDPIEGEDLKCNYSATNYSESDSTIGGHLAGIDNALASHVNQYLTLPLTIHPDVTLWDDTGTDDRDLIGNYTAGGAGGSSGYPIPFNCLIQSISITDFAGCIGSASIIKVHVRNSTTTQETTLTLSGPSTFATGYDAAAITFSYGDILQAYAETVDNTTGTSQGVINANVVLVST